MTDTVHAAEPKGETGRGPEKANGQPTMLSRGLEGTVNLAKKGVVGLAGGIWRRVKGVFSGAWEATGGQVTGEAKEISQRLGYESHETGSLHAIAGIIEAGGRKVGSVVGGVMDYTIGAPARAAGRVLRGAQNVVTGVLLGKTYPAGGGAPGPLSSPDSGRAAPEH